MAEQIPAELAKTPNTSDRDFAQIVRRHQAMVYSIALHFLIDSAAAEELAQDVFLQLYANLANLHSDDHIKFWLRRVTGYRSVDSDAGSEAADRTDIATQKKASQSASGRFVCAETRRAFWQARFYDFNVWTTKKRVEKLRYMHRNPVKRGLVDAPEQWALE